MFRLVEVVLSEEFQRQNALCSLNTATVGLLQNAILRKFPFLKIRNSGRNHGITVVPTAKLLVHFSERAILQQPRFSCNLPPSLLYLCQINKHERGIFHGTNL